MKKNLPELLKAIDKLIDHYSKYEMYEVPLQYHWATNEYCPLCVFGESLSDKIYKCYACPWVFFDGHDCQTPDFNFDNYTTKERLDRLQGWKKRLQR